MVVWGAFLWGLLGVDYVVPAYFGSGLDGDYKTHGNESIDWYKNYNNLEVSAGDTLFLCGKYARVFVRHELKLCGYISTGRMLN